MPNTNKMQWSYPARDDDPWYEKFEQLTIAQDSSGYASREDRQIIMGGGGDVTFDAGTSSLTWAVDLDFYSLISGFRVSLPATTVVIEDGEVLYLNLTRAPTQNISVSTASASQVPNTDDAMALAIRVGTTVYWRHGSKIESGDTVNIFGVPGLANQGDTFEREATFIVPNGGVTSESTVGRMIIAGSLFGLSASVTEAITGGTLVVNVKINAVTAMTATLDATDSTLKQVVTSPGTHPIGVGDQITVEAVATGLTTASTLDIGLTVNVGLSSGVLLPPGGHGDASLSIKGITRLSLDPVLSTDPIAVGDNDPRVIESRRVIRAIVQPADGSAFTVSFSPAMPSTNYIITYTLATVGSHFTVSTPEVGKTVNDFTVVTSAPPGNSETIYFYVVEI